jgi:hypothetical protein
MVSADLGTDLTDRISLFRAPRTRAIAHPTFRLGRLCDAGLDSWSSRRSTPLAVEQRRSACLGLRKPLTPPSARLLLWAKRSSETALRPWGITRSVAPRCSLSIKAAVRMLRRAVQKRGHGRSRDNP